MRREQDALSQANMAKQAIAPERILASSKILCFFQYCCCGRQPLYFDNGNPDLCALKGRIRSCAVNESVRIPANGNRTCAAIDSE